MAAGVSPYPTEALLAAGASLLASWRRSSSVGGSCAQRVRRLHDEHPPTLRVANELPYPHEAPMQQPSAEAEAATATATATARKRPAPAPTIAGSVKRRRLGDSDAGGSAAQRLLQCDLCCRLHDTEPEALRHLAESGHATASLCVRLPAGLRLLRPKLLTVGAVGAATPLAAVCPLCHLPFEDRFACGLHHALLHNGCELWAERPVLRRFSLTLLPGNNCSCGAAFDSARGLHQHWQEGGGGLRRCCPLPPATQQPCSTVAACPLCPRLFLGVSKPSASSSSNVDDGDGGDGDSERVLGALLMARAHVLGHGAGRPLRMLVTVVGLADGLVRTVPPMLPTHLSSSSSSLSSLSSSSSLASASAPESLRRCRRLAAELLRWTLRFCGRGHGHVRQIRWHLDQMRRADAAGAAGDDDDGDGDGDDGDDWWR